MSLNSKKSYLNIGNEKFRAGDFKGAVKYFELAMIENPAISSLAEFNMGMAKKYLKRDGQSKNISFVKDQIDDSDIDNNSEILYGFKEKKESIDIIVPVFNALHEVKLCLQSLEINTEGYSVRVFVINDGSDIETTEWLRKFCKNKPLFCLLENKENLGYTKAVNIGLKRSNSDYIVTLNSDTIVTRGWLSGFLYCFSVNDGVGVVGPLSNAASWQTVPVLLDDSNHFMVNDLPKGWTLDKMATLVRRASHRIYPEVPFVNGFCFMFKREVLDVVGFLDEKAFPTGYGEENDYCIRIASAGYKLVIADDIYVFHAKSKSFGHEKRKVLSQQGNSALRDKYGDDKIKYLSNLLRNSEKLLFIRNNIVAAINKCQNQEKICGLSKRILFLLPVSGGGGGVHSVFQEVLGMRRLGIRTNIAVPKKHLDKFLRRYEYINGVDKIFLPFDDNDIVNISYKFDIIIGTIYTSMKLIKRIVEKNKGIQTAYYVQDYEPFFETPFSEKWNEARLSYTLVPNTILFAKTQWLCDKVYDEHKVFVNKVVPSIDHSIYRINPEIKIKDGLGNKIVISAMIRPKTPRRGAQRTMKLLKGLYEIIDDIHIEIFGCSDVDLQNYNLDTDFPFINSGELNQLGVARILQKSDYFIDLSDYQAFGRTGLEAMACGCFVIITKYGGVYEYVNDGVNAIVVDPFDLQKIIFVLNDHIKNEKIDKLKQATTAADFTINKASLSELLVLTS